MLHLEMRTCLHVTTRWSRSFLEGRSFILTSRWLPAVPCPTLAHQLSGLSLMLSLSFLHRLSFSSLPYPVNLVMEKQEVHFLLTWELRSGEVLEGNCFRSWSPLASESCLWAAWMCRTWECPWYFEVRISLPCLHSCPSGSQKRNISSIFLTLKWGD